ncbi:beta-ketoacyl-ACP synthase II [Gemmatimonas groenlandica]|uniref:3-oxoacyl-[acyl-carrier-protein] synthase 2 n=1 Tax=Gemmatimonas groenlandica TaxID=2732249 RepID=A0A6M4INK5_9BACT|nr:beta-ketoacyl-ACP synthase II [Gemmatimonas groenlandica]QJR35067.1 beta-ketoacyl-ACP synthase II [Gemmatimonas groenlandica]
MRRRVVVTGLGAVTPVGNDVATTWQSLLSGVSGGADITKFDASKYSVRFACEVKQFDPLSYMDRKEAKRADVYAQYAVAASVQAAADAGIAPGGIDPEMMGVIIGSGIGGIRSFEDQHDVYRTLGPSKISPFFIPMFIGDIAAGIVSMRLQAKGPNYATVSACASSAHAIGDAFRIIQYGDADVMFAGGSEAAVTPMSIGGFANMGALSTRNDSPATASRPFDKDRDGFVMGEGSGVVVLEELEHARRRGARIYGEIVGYRATGDAYHLTGQPEAHEGLQRAMRGALKDGGLAPTDVDYINAHGTSTPLNDPNESKGIQAVFGDHARVLSISSTKSATGHMLGAAGSVEFIACALAMRDSMVPPTINYATPDPECVLDYTPNTPRARAVNVAISNSSGFGGHNVSIALRRWHD